MTGTLTIAKRDLRSQLYSIRGGLTFWLFLIFSALFFRTFVVIYMEMQQNAPMMGGQTPTLEQLMRAIFANAHFILLFVIPGVTMASFAEEKRTHSFRLLQTAPVSSLAIVLGKFIANAGLMFFVLLASLVYLLFLVKYGNPDLGTIWTFNT